MLHNGKVEKHMDINEKRTDEKRCCSVEYYESWLTELIEQNRDDKKRAELFWFVSLAVNVILAAVVLFR